MNSEVHLDEQRGHVLTLPLRDTRRHSLSWHRYPHSDSLQGPKMLLVTVKAPPDSLFFLQKHRVLELLLMAC